MRIVFVHTPMASVPLPIREQFWHSFDKRYHAMHPGLRPMKKVLWEIPHWMTWLGGVLEKVGYTDLTTLDLYTSECAFGGIDKEFVRKTVTECPGDVFLFSPMTPNLFFAFQIADVVKEIYPEAITIFGGIVATPPKRESV